MKIRIDERMLKIAICDSDALAAKLLEENLKNCLKRFGAAAETAFYQDASFLREILLKKETDSPQSGISCEFDYIFTEAWLPEGANAAAPLQRNCSISCLPLLAELKQKYQGANLILVTGHTETIFEALRIPVYYFVRKEFLTQDLEAACLKIRDDGKKRPGFHVFSSGTKTVKTAIDDILYFESFKHTVTVHMTDGEITLITPLSSLFKEFEPFDFMQIHKSYIVNLYHVKRIDGIDITLSDGTALPASRHRLPDIRSRYDTYIRRLGWMH